MKRFFRHQRRMIIIRVNQRLWQQAHEFLLSQRGRVGVVEFHGNGFCLLQQHAFVRQFDGVEPEFDASIVVRVFGVTGLFGKCFQ